MVDEVKIWHSSFGPPYEFYVEFNGKIYILDYKAIRRHNHPAKAVTLRPDLFTDMNAYNTMTEYLSQRPIRERLLGRNIHDTSGVRQAKDLARVMKGIRSEHEASLSGSKPSMDPAYSPAARHSVSRRK